MKAIKIFTGLSIVALACSLSLHAVAGGNSYKVNTEKSNIKWTGEKVAGEHTGNISLKSGELNVNKGKIEGGSLVMDMTTITCTDLDGEWRDKLIGHLKSDDFFGVSNHATSSFKITKVIPMDGNKIQIVGKLTIKGITKDIEFVTDYSEKDGVITAKGEMIVNRTLFNIKYGSGSFFDDLGDKAISDEFKLEFTLVASK